MMRERTVGCLIGGAIGDALGAPAEGGTAAPVEMHTPPYVTDDTVLTIATARSFSRKRRVDPESIAAEMLAEYRLGIAGLGASTLHALEHLSAGGHWALSGRAGDMAAGNGAAMRIAPLAFVLDPSSRSDRRIIRDVSRITHRSDEAYVGALAVVIAIRAAVSGSFDQPDFELLPSIAAQLPDSRVRDALLNPAVKSCGSIPDLAGLLGTSGFVAESVPFALASVAASAEVGVLELLNEVVAAGGDTDTNASIAGQVMGAARGIDRIPMVMQDWVRGVENLTEVVKEFADAVEARVG